MSLIGGWAVYERVQGGHAQQSRDVDLVLHSEDALVDLLRQTPQWGLAWRTRGRGRLYPDAHFVDEDPLEFRLDVFTTARNATWDHRFGRAGSNNVKGIPPGLVPSTEWLLNDKIQVVPLRSHDADDKRAKDFLDIHSLIFHNNAGHLPRALLAATRSDERAAALPFLDVPEADYPQYSNEYAAVRAWLALP